jgi:DNA polymerase-3 subunit delta'
VENFIGNERIIERLCHAVAARKTSHAYLITGPRQIGKRTLALSLARSIQCHGRSDSSGNACGYCSDCHKAASGNHPDTQTMELPKDRQHYSIDQIREMIEGITLKPTEGYKRIFIIPDADLLTPQALQSSLKILEEPPPDGMIIITCVSSELLLPTIISRCQEISLVPVLPETLASILIQRYNIDPDRAHDLSLMSSGRPGWAITAIDQPDLLAEQHTMLHDLAKLVGSSRSDHITSATKYAADKDHARATIELWISWWRDVLLASQGANTIIRHREDRELIEQIACQWGSTAAEQMVRAQILALDSLEKNGNPRMIFEVMLQSLPGTA